MFALTRLSRSLEQADGRADFKSDKVDIEFSSKTFISEHLKMFLDILQNLNAPLRDILQDLYIPLPIARTCFVVRSTVHSE